MRRHIAARLVQSSSRTLHVLDIENLAQSAHVTPSMVRRIRLDYQRCVEIGPRDQLVVGISHHNAPALFGQLGGARLVVQSGPSGADLALIEVLESESVGARFDSVCVASGDGLFAGALASIAAEGAKTFAVSRPGCMSARLRLAAGSSIELTYRAENERSVA